MTTVLVTGGAGFLGRHLVGHLLARGHTVRVLDNAPRERWHSLAGAEQIPGDVRDEGCVERATAGAGAVVHAAFAPPQAPLAALEEVNVEATRHLGRAAAAAGAARLVLVSSTIVEQPLRSPGLLTRSPLARLDAYRRSRLASEAVVRGLGDELAVAVVRPRTFVGPGQVGGFALLLETIRAGGVVVIPGRGQSRYQLLDVRDLAEGVSRLVESTGDGTYRLGAPGASTVAQDLHGLIAHAGTGAGLVGLPAGLARLGMRATELAGLAPLASWYQVAAGRTGAAEATAGLDELGWAPRRSNLEALSDTYDWYAGVREANRSAPTTHPVPGSHRALDRALSVLPRRLLRPIPA